MNLLFENWRQYLTEVSFEDAKEILNSKGTLKIIKNYEYEMSFPNRPGGTTPESRIAHDHKQFKDWLLEAIPDDLTDNQKGTAILWLRKLAKEDSHVARAFIDGLTGGNRNSKYGRLWDDFEAFFHHQRFMPQQDLMSVKSIDDLQKMVDEAKDDIHAAMGKKQYLDAEAGIEVLSGKMERNEETGKLERRPGKNGWFIAIMNNKGAACELGKETDWCTAAPGLDYFEEYYEPDDPLFFFEGFWTDPSTRFQFHYGSESFMDSNDSPVNDKTFKTLHDLLMRTDAPENYQVVQHKQYEMIAGDSDTPSEELADIIDYHILDEELPHPVLAKVAKNAKTPLEALKKLYRSTHDKYIIRNIQINPVIDFALAKEIFISNPKDELIYSRGMKQMTDYKRWGISFEEVNKIINAVEAARNYEPRQIPQEVANLREHKFKIRINK